MRVRALRGALVTTGAAALSVALATAPASAHYCFKNYVQDHAAAGMAGSHGWESFHDLAAEFTGLCDAGIEVLADAAGIPSDTLINAHGLMAGGLEKQGRSNKAIGHLDFAAVEGAGEAAAAACASS